MRIIILAAVLAAGGAAAAETEADRWKLTDVYAGAAEWNADATKLESQIKAYGACKGHLGDGVAKFKLCEDLYWDAQKRLSRLQAYSEELLDEDTTKSSSLELSQRFNVLAASAAEVTSFRDPEILKLGKKKIDAYLAADKSLAIDKQPLADILRRAPHTLDANAEQIVATFGLTADIPQSTYTILSTADLPWPTVKLSDGTEAHLDQAGYTKYRAVQNRDDRRKVMDTFFGKWKEYEHTLGVTFYGMLKQSTVYSRVRKYPDSLSQALDANHVPPAVYDMLIEQTNANLPTLHRYFKLRAKMLGVSDMHYYDIYPPIVKSSLKFPADQGKQMMLEAMKPLGDDYVARVRQGLADRWMDLYPRPHKLPGAHMDPGASYDVHPLLLINYNDDYESVSTISHEWGHAMHTDLANHAQPYPTSSYSIFVAEIASTLNEALLLDSMLKSAKSDDEKLYYLGSALEQLRGTFFRQAMFADFEREVHARVDKGDALTGEQLTRIYGDILKRYHGDAQGIVKIDDVDCVEWAYIPHFYGPFYVYQYATSIAASSQFANQILSNQPGARDRYLNLLKAGASDYPYELVKKAGVDLATPAPYQALAKRMDSIMDQIEAILARKK
ncbi:MAG TPA: oligoendopeptidase F [Nevskiaceae bacterium]|nr:oligoendopeptidase F [Nevskiaceae bacterium]